MNASGSGDHRRQRLAALRDAALRRTVHARRAAPGFTGRWTRRQWMQASLIATVGMLVAAIVPGFDVEVSPQASLQRQSMALALPPLPLSRQQGIQGDSWQIVHVQPGQTLAEIFEELEIPAATLQRILEHPGTKPALTRLKPGAELGFDLPVDGGLRTLRFERDESHRVELTFESDRIVEKVIERPVETRKVVLSGEIGSGSLYAAARRAGLTPSMIEALTDDIFKYDIDFDKDLQRGDRFSVVVDEKWREGEKIGSGPILAAAFTTGERMYTAFRYERNGKGEYFTADGRPLKKSFIRMPIPYARLTSGFGSRRHPVLGIMRMHKGVDYGAGSGTPIMAAGDARVQFVGWKGGYGRTVILDHGRGYTTLYGHMSRFGKIKTGQRIPQGTVIGYVGSSGLATGPHLHYEFRINGVHRNPLSITMPPPEPLRGAELAAFRLQTAPALARIQQVENIIYAGTQPPPRKPRRGKA
ncbi:MAG TPA: M23 family metallopeptidase [Lysobacter sp.]|nr:M23 family metallopeptidase [Lysobacter sp.]